MNQYKTTLHVEDWQLWFDRASSLPKYTIKHYSPVFRRKTAAVTRPATGCLTAAPLHRFTTSIYDAYAGRGNSPNTFLCPVLGV